MTSEPYADVRDMYMAHTMFRREFGLLPELISAVKPGDVARAQVIAGHFDLVYTVLRHHHEGEDEHLWPRLRRRAGDGAALIVATMEHQHEQIKQANTEVVAAMGRWRDTADPDQGAALADAAERLAELLAEHLAVEEDEALPLVRMHITAAEWTQMVLEGGAGLDPEQLPLMFGLMMYEGEPETVRDILTQMPPGAGEFMAATAPGRYAEHAALVYGTATPPRVGARR